MFLQEEINGQVLAECDEHILQNELQVTSKLHRTKLMRLITGQLSACQILSQE